MERAGKICLGMALIWLTTGGCNSGLCATGCGSAGTCAPTEVCNALSGIHPGCPNLGEPQGTCTADLGAGVRELLRREHALDDRRLPGRALGPALTGSEPQYLLAVGKCFPDGGSGLSPAPAKPRWGCSSRLSSATGGL